MSENARQEIALQFGDKQFLVRPTFEVIATIESALNQSARSVGLKALAAGMTAADRGAQPEISLTELAMVIYWMLRGQQGAPENASQAGDIMMDYGYGDLLLPVGQFLTRAQRGHREHVKEAEARAAAAEKEAGEAGAAKGPTLTAD